MTIVHVEFDWTDEFGTCYDCGHPAFFALPDAYNRAGEEPQPIDDKHKRCALCAANAAAEDGERIIRLDTEDEL
jgi:hypothetical protein